MRLTFSDRGARPAGAPATPPKAPAAEIASFASSVAAGPPSADAEFFELKTRLHRHLIERMNLSTLDRRPAEQVRTEVLSLTSELLREEARPLNEQETRRLIDDLMHELLGFGPLEPLLQDPTVSDILVNTAEEVYVERQGSVELTEVRFADEQHLLRVIQRIVDKVGRRVDESQPLVDARLPDGSRVNAVVPPIAVDGSLLSIRKFSRIPFDLERLVAVGSMPASWAELLGNLVRCRLNILISGGTGTGKTTMLNAMSKAIGERERIVTIEDAAELQLQQRHVARLETRPANIEGRGEITQRDLVKNALRMRPDRIIVGEVRAGEAFDMLQAMNTGHDGSMTTIHANTARDALSRLEQMIGMAGLDLPMRAVRAQIASAIDIVMQIRRFGDGKRRLVSVCEIEGMEGDVITMQEVLRFEQTHVDDRGHAHGRFSSTGIRPHFFGAFQANGLKTPESLTDLC
jgi:pilus assembly protein CpaF